jgi:hypothetical protein
MNMRPKRIPRLWCALQGLLPLNDCLDAQRAELAWPAEPDLPDRNVRNRVAVRKDPVDVRRRGPK